MSLQQWFAIAALGCLPLAATAQQESPKHAPADVNAPATTLRYESAFSNYRTGGDESQAPDGIWRAANAEVQGHGGQEGHSMAPVDTEAHNHATHAVPINMDHGHHH